MAWDGGAAGGLRGKERRRERKRPGAPDGPLARWRAYRAASEVLEHGMDLWKLADRRARLASMLLVPLIIVLLLILVQHDIFEPMPDGLRAGVVVAILAYGGLAVAMFSFAIGVLRPDVPEPTAGAGEGEDAPLGIRHYPDVLSRDLPDYQRAWREVRMGQLVAEVAAQAHALAKSNRRRYRALHRLFRGLEAMTALAVFLLLALGVALWLTRGAP